MSIMLNKIYSIYKSPILNKKQKAPVRKKSYSKAFKLEVIKAIRNKGDLTKSDIARQYKISPSMLAWIERSHGLVDKEHEERTNNKKTVFFNLINSSIKYSLAELEGLVGAHKNTLCRWKRQQNIDNQTQESDLNEH